MSQERAKNDLTTEAGRKTPAPRELTDAEKKIFGDDPDQEEVKTYLLLTSDLQERFLRQKKKARFAVALARGLVQNRLDVRAKKGIHVEWTRNDPLEIHALATLGFEPATQQHLESRGNPQLHDNGDGSIVVGDVILMATSMENKELIDEVREEQKQRRHGKPGAGGVSEEEKNLKRDIEQQLAQYGIKPIQEGKQREGTVADLTMALRAAQTQVSTPR